jgi:hypothetical protein
MAAGPLPAVRSPSRLRTTDHPSAAALGTEAATSDMIDNHSIPGLKAPYTRANTLDNTTRLVTSDNTLIRLRAASLIDGPIDCPQIATTQRRRFHPYKYLSMPRLWNRDFAQIKLSIAWQDNASHCLHNTMPFRQKNTTLK